MLVLEILDDDMFETLPITLGFLRKFVLRMLTYLRTKVPPSRGHYTRTSYVRHPGLSIKWHTWVSGLYLNSYNFVCFSGVTFMFRT